MKLRYYLLTILCCGVIFWLSSLQVTPRPKPVLPIDKLVHMSMYAALAGVVCIGMRRSNNTVDARKLFYIPLCFSIGYGIAEEFYQLFLSWRSFDFFDIIANSAGALLAQIFLCQGLWKMPLRSATGLKQETLPCAEE